MPKNLEHVKDDILSVTRKMLADEGYNKLNIRTIASRCGIATGTLYNYYSSKQEIVIDMLQVEWNMMLRRIDQVTKASGDILEKLENVYLEISTLMNNVHNIWFVDSYTNGDTSDFSRVKIQKDSLYKELTKRIESLIRVGEKEGINSESISRDKDVLEDTGCSRDIRENTDSKRDFDMDTIKDYEFLSDVICRLFLSYSLQKNVTFSKLGPIIRSMLL